MKRYSASDIAKFVYCPESWRLDELKRKGLIEVDKEAIEMEQNRFNKGIEYHLENQPQKRKSETGIIIATIIFIIVAVKLLGRLLR
jgi:hypothetical protein